MKMLEGKAAFITGAASGIGRASALRMAEEGAAVGVVDLPAQQAAGEDVVTMIQAAGGQAVFVPCDVGIPEQVQAAIDRTVNELGRLDIVFANAGINGVWAPIEDLQPHEWDRTMAVNLRGTYLTTHYAIGHLRRTGGGSIIVCSSINGTRSFGTAGATAYSTSKSAQVAFMQMAARELARYQIRVNAICPGAVNTQINQSTQKRNTDAVDANLSPTDDREFPAAEPEDVADVCVFLASRLSRHVSGATIFVDRGVSLTR